MTRIETHFKMVFSAAILAAAVALPLFGQSTSQEFPTPVGSNEIVGTIKARDIGDSRLTTYYFTFNSEQGDLFINLVTRNLTGDIDVFAVSGLRPLTKIAVYADYGENETGRAIYLRKPEKLLLRVQGRTPNDDEAAFRLKFAGSFVAVRPEDSIGTPEPPKVNPEARAGIRVNSVGTILPTESKPAEATVENRKPENSEAAAVVVAPDEISELRRSPNENKAVEKRPGKAAEIDRENPAPAKVVPPAARKTRPARRTTPAKPSLPAKEAEEITAVNTEAPTERSNSEIGNNKKPDDKNIASKSSKSGTTLRTLTDKKDLPSAGKKEPKPDPLASINLVIQFKDGKLIERKMNEVFKFSVDKGVLTVILKDGGISKFQIVDVAKITIE